LSRSQNLRIPRILILLLVLAGLIALIVLKDYFKSGPIPPSQSEPGKVDVLDGDTFVDAEGQTIRLLGIDTPEKGQAFADQATAELREMLKGGPRLRYEFGKERKDRYGRLLAFVYADSIFVNERLIEDGMASAYFFEGQLGSVLFEELCNAQRAAMRDHVGIWSLEVARPESVYNGNRRSRRFHRPDCSAVSSGETNNIVENPSREYFLSECYSPCRNCKP
jgi:micrococcal nuclease